MGLGVLTCLALSGMANNGAALQKLLPGGGEAGRSLRSGTLQLGDYPFYMQQPTAAMDAVYDRHSVAVQRVLNAVEIFRMGSSALVGMPGTVSTSILSTVG